MSPSRKLEGLSGGMFSNGSERVSRMSQRRWPPLPIVEEEADSLAREVRSGEFLDDELDVPNRGTLNQKVILLGPEDEDYDSAFTPDFSIDGRGRAFEPSDLGDDTTASTIFTHRTPSPYAYTQSSTSASSNRRRNSFHSRHGDLDGGAAELVKSTPSSPIPSKEKDNGPYPWSNAESYTENYCSDSDYSCRSPCSGCSDEMCEGPYRFPIVDSKRQTFSQQPSNRSSDFWGKEPATPSNIGLAGRDNIQPSPSSKPKIPGKRDPARTPPLPRLSTPGSDGRAEAPPAFVLSPPAEEIADNYPPRPGHRHSKSCNAVPQSPTFNKPRRIIDHGEVLRNKLNSTNLSPNISPKSGCSHKLPFSRKGDDIPSAYHSQPSSRRGSRSGSPAPPSQSENTAPRNLSDASSPPSQRPSGRKRHHYFHSSVHTDAPQIIVQPPVEDEVPVASSVAKDGASSLNMEEPMHALPEERISTSPGRKPLSGHAEQAYPDFSDNCRSPGMARSHSDDPRSRPYGGTWPRFFDENRTNANDLLKGMSPSGVPKDPDEIGRGTTDFYDYYDATPLPPCPRADLAYCKEWYVLRGSPNTVVCPSCLHNIVPEDARHRFVRALPPYSGTAMVCDFSCSWMRAAWLISLRGGNIDLDFLEQISSLKPDDGLGCLPRSYSDTGGWHTLRSRHNVQKDDFLMCLSCTKRMTTILPSMGGEVKRISRERIRGQPTCIFRPQNQQASVLISELIAAQMAALRSGCSAIDLSRFIMQVQNLQNMRGDLHGYVDSSVGVDDTDDDNNSAEDRDDSGQVRRWHIIPNLPVCTVCEPCFQEAVWPALEAGRPLAQLFTIDGMPGRKGSSGPHDSRTFSPPSPVRPDRRHGHSRYHRRRSSRRSILDDDVFAPGSSHDQTSDEPKFRLAILGDGTGRRGGCTTNNGLERICYLHSPRMRSEWQKALQTNDFEVLKAAVMRLRSRQLALQEKILELRRVKEKMKAGGAANGLGDRLGDRLGDAFRQGLGGRESRRYRRKSMGSVDARVEPGPSFMNAYMVERELKKLEEEWLQLKDWN